MKEKIELFKDRNDNLYIKTGAKKGFMVRISDGTRHDGTTAGDFIPLSTPEDDPYSYWPCCDVEGCDQVSCRGGGCWKETGYWSVCPDHSQMFRDGKPQPQMKQSAIDREKSRDEDGCLPVKQQGKECTCLSRKAIPMGYYFKCSYCGLKIPPTKQPKPEGAKEKLKKFWDYLIVKRNIQYETPELMEIVIEDYLDLLPVENRNEPMKKMAAKEFNKQWLRFNKMNWLHEYIEESGCINESDCLELVNMIISHKLSNIKKMVEEKRDESKMLLNKAKEETNAYSLGWHRGNLTVLTELLKTL